MQATDGGFIAGGEAGEELLVMKLDTEGEILWQRTYGPAPAPQSIRPVGDGGYLVAARREVIKLDGGQYI